jgi:ATP-dependent Clp protease ATP-binding subunit ClpA
MVAERSSLLNQFIAILTRWQCSHPFLIGASGIGRTTLLQQFKQAWESRRLFLPTALKNLPFHYLDIETLSLKKNSPEKPWYVFLKELAPLPGIIALDGLDALPHLSETAQCDILHGIKDILLHPQGHLILTSTPENYKTYFLSDSFFIPYLQPIELAPLSLEEAIKMVHTFLPTLRDHHSLAFDATMIPSVVALAARYVKHLPLPASAIFLLDATASAIRAKNESHQIQWKDIVHWSAKEWDLDPQNLLLSPEEKAFTSSEYLSQTILGQSIALKRIQQTLCASLIKTDDATPLSTLLFIGSPFSGKRKTAHALARLLYGHERYLHIFNLAEFSSFTQLMDTPLVGLLAQLHQNPDAIFLFENVERADQLILTRLLTFLTQRQEINLSKTLFILVCNDILEAPTQDSPETFLSTDSDQATGFLQLVLTGFSLFDRQETASTTQQSTLHLDTDIAKRLGTPAIQALSIIPFIALHATDLEKFLASRLQKLQKTIQERYQKELIYAETFPEDFLAFLQESSQLSIQGITYQLNREVTPLVMQTILQQQTCHLFQLFMDHHNSLVCQGLTS